MKRAVVLVVWCAAAGCIVEEPEWPYVATFGGTELRVEPALTPEEQAHGLMYRDELGLNRGMLFAYPEDAQLAFWMKNTKIPLSIAFIDKDRVVRDIQDMDALSEETHVSSVPVRYAIEVNRGWFASHGIKPGTTVKFSAKLEELLKSKAPK